MSQALYRKYRSKSLAEIVGQRHITDILSQAIKSGRISHAYLLTGPRGVGKTSVARILAHEINGLPYTDDSSHLDIIEIDAASNNGVEDVRDLREKVQIAPVSAAKKVYIIDEVHMLSKAAFNALLKTLEEPPEHVVFILATTDADKLPATIVSRTQRYGFRAITLPDAVAQLRTIADAEHITVDDAALATIAERGDGSFRDSISLLDQLSNLTNGSDGITAELVETALGIAPVKVIEALLQKVASHDIKSLSETLQQTFADGIGASVLAEQLIRHIRQTIADTPQLLPLLDALLDVSKSSQPEIKLLTVLAAAALETKPLKTAALKAPAREIKGTIAELTKKAVTPNPSMAEPPVQPSSEHDIVSHMTPSDPFDWEALIEYARTHYVALFSVLSKCSSHLDGETLYLYTNSKFYKKKLDDPKYSTHLFDCISHIVGGDLTVVTVPTAPPPKDSQAAAVAAIMGGGEEVNL